jgi:hypothetical protein
MLTAADHELLQSLRYGQFCQILSTGCGLTYFILVRMAVPLDPLLLVLITGSCCVRCLCLGRGDKLSFTLAGISCVWSDDVGPPPPMITRLLRLG